MNLKKGLWLALLQTCFSSFPAVFGQAVDVKSGLQAPAQAVRLEADLAESRVYIKVATSTRLGHDHGVVGRLESGQVTLGQNGELVFAMKTFITDTPEARKYVGLTAPVKPADQQKSTANMLGPDVLDVQKYPRATFKIMSCQPMDGQAAGAAGGYQVNGTFTLHGVSRPLSFAAKVEPTSDVSACRVSGVFAINQSGFGIRPYTALGGLVGIQDRLEIWGDFVMKPATSPPGTSARTAK
jgi:hypothetical protein